jgi:hypothetical protein
VSNNDLDDLVDESEEVTGFTGSAEASASRISTSAIMENPGWEKAQIKKEQKFKSLRYLKQNRSNDCYGRIQRNRCSTADTRSQTVV